MRPPKKHKNDLPAECRCCGALGWWPNANGRAKSLPKGGTYCRRPGCAPKGLLRAFMMRATAEEKAAARKRNAKKVGAANKKRRADRAAERRAKRPKRSDDDDAADLAARWEELWRALQRVPRDGTRLTHDDAMMCLCNFSVTYLLADYDPYVRIAALKLLGCLSARTLDVVAVPKAPVLDALASLHTIDSERLDERDPRAFVKLNVERNPLGTIQLPKPPSKLVERYDAAPAANAGGRGAFTHRVSIQALCLKDLPRAPALAQGDDVVYGVCSSNSVDESGHMVVAVPAFDKDGIKIILEVLLLRRQLVLAHILKWSKKDFEALKRLYCPRRIKTIVKTKFSGQEACQAVERFWGTYRPFLDVLKDEVWAALEAYREREGELPSYEAFAAALDGGGDAVPMLEGFRGEKASAKTLGKLTTELTGTVDGLNEVLRLRGGGADTKCKTSSRSASGGRARNNNGMPANTAVMVSQEGLDKMRW